MYKTKKGKPVDSSSWKEGKAEKLLKRGIIVLDKESKKVKEKPEKKESKKTEEVTEESKKPKGSFNPFKKK